ncbi:MAG: AMP-binding protein, partial [Bizionia sp.]|nr:AMP-binding protein [Bizionia sp.]
DYKTIHSHFKLNGDTVTITTLKEKARFFVKEGVAFEKEIGQFLLEWLKDSPNLQAKTSGSTGAPKPIVLQKQAMVNSAVATGAYFNLKPGSTALLCLPATYIAGKMMLVRAMVLGLEIDCVSPQSEVVFNTNTVYDFAAMVPMQLLKTSHKLQNIKQLIVGGAPVSNSLLDKIQTVKTTVYETYGMTETVSHIAVKKLNNLRGTNSITGLNTAHLSFEVLPNISISQDKRACLVIEASQLLENTIVTNDIVELQSETTFKWLGRFDNVINSGGIKIHPEQIEATLKRHIHTRFFIASEVDDRLGNALILVIEGNKITLEPSVFEALENYKKPKAVYFIDAFAETSSGKIQRQKTLALVKKL